MSGDFEIGDRLVTLIKMSDIEAGKVVTLEQFINEQIGIVRHDIDAETQLDKFTGISITSLRRATFEEIQTVKNKDRLLPKQYRVGQRWRALKNFKLDKNSPREDVVTIVDYVLDIQVNLDMYIVESTDGSRYEVKRNLLDTHFVYYNPNVEETLGDEVQFQGEPMYFRPGTRVRLKKEIVCDDTRLPLFVDEIVLLIDINEGTNKARVSVNWDDHELYATTELENLYPATLDEVRNAQDYKKFVDRRFWEGSVLTANNKVQNVWELSNYINPGETIEITKIHSLSNYVLEDIFEVKCEQGYEIRLNAYDLHSYFDSTTNRELEQDTTEDIEVIQEVEHKQEQDNSLEKEFYSFIHEISINGYRFKVNDDKTIETKFPIQLENLDSYVKVLNELKRIILNQGE